MNDFSVNSAWYTDTGIDNDVVLSTRVRLARNLSDFPFPEFMKNDSNERLLSVVFDAFSKLDDNRNYQALSLGNVEEIGRYILVERGVMPAGMIDKPGSGIIVSSDGHISCTVNYHNHLHISSFIAGYSPLEAYNLVNSLDASLQNYLQFAGNSEFGYFTSRLKDTGTGMKISAMLHLPSVVEAGLQDELFKTLVKSICFLHTDSRVKCDNLPVNISYVNRIAIYKHQMTYPCTRQSFTYVASDATESEHGHSLVM